MKLTALTLMVALVGGAIGGVFAPRLLAPRSTTEDGTARGTSAAEARDLETRIAALEAGAQADARPRLAGRTDAAPAPVPHLAPAAQAELVEALKARIDEHVEAKVEEIVAREGLGATEKAEEEKKERRRLTLSEAAGEVGLSAAQELALRDIYSDYEQNWVEILTGEDGDQAATRADLEVFKSDPASRKRLGQKYLPRIVGKLPQVMAAELGRDSAITEAVGEETKQLLDAFDIEEAGPFGAGGNVSIGAQMSADR